MKTTLLTILTLLALTCLGQTEEEKRAIIAAKNKIQSDSLSLESRSMRVRECKKQNDILLDAIENAYKTIELQSKLEKSLETDLDLCSDSLKVANTQLDKVTADRDKQEKRKKVNRNAFLVTLGVAIVELAIIIL